MLVGLWYAVPLCTLAVAAAGVLLLLACFCCCCIAGSEVVQESLLQSCLYSITKVTPPEMKEGEFSREWWLYHQRLGDVRDGCSFSGKVGEARQHLGAGEFLGSRCRI